LKIYAVEKAGKTRIIRNGGTKKAIPSAIQTVTHVKSAARMSKGIST
jgi:hypothetical protein